MYSLIGKASMNYFFPRNMYLFAADTALVISHIDRSFLEIETLVQSEDMLQWLSNNILAMKI